MRSPVIIVSKTRIPLFAEKPSHSSAPLDRQSADARSAGPGRPSAGASRASLTVASTLAGWWFGGERPILRSAILMLAGVLSIGTVPSATLAQSAPAVRTVIADPYDAHVAEASQRFGIPELWIRAVLRAESAGNARALSPVGAIGLMQVMPGTWAALRVRYRLGRDPYDPHDNIFAGTAYLREMWDRYGNVAAMLAAYNAGPGRTDEYLATGRALPAETRAYVAALAPLLGGAAVTDMAASVSPPPPDWRDAPIFVARRIDAGAANAPSFEAQPGDIRAAVPARDPVVTKPQNDSIFMLGADDGGTP